MTNKRNSDNGSRTIVVKTIDGTVYTTQSVGKINADDMAYAMMTTPMLVATNRQTGEKELVMTTSVISFTFEGGLNEEDVKTLTTPDESGDNKKDTPAFSLDDFKDGTNEVH